LEGVPVVNSDVQYRQLYLDGYGRWCGVLKCCGVNTLNNYQFLEQWLYVLAIWRCARSGKLLLTDRATRDVPYHMQCLKRCAVPPAVPQEMCRTS